MGQWKQAAESNQAEALKAGLQKFGMCPNGQTVPEHKSLVAAATMSSDSPVKKKKKKKKKNEEELQQQLYHEP